ncbi:MAG: hypothetical protein NZM25_07405 [Leptospiraceae bacterium]|nr:hypothetical protein [Leptospiraceae bacterium]MDW8307709.1 hypothetical protein [Leptospiraceae bacterium]
MVRFLNTCLLAFFLSGCCSIVIPPVTLTGSKTAAERQIIGESAELEKDVWLVASARTASRVKLDYRDENESATQFVEGGYAYEAFLILDTFEKKLKELKKDRVVGENNRGLVSNLLLEKNYTVPENIRQKYDEKLKDDLDKGLPYRTLVETVEQINRARLLLARAYIENQKKANPNFKAKEEEILVSQKASYQEAALKGEMIQLDDGRWIAKP